MWNVLVRGEFHLLRVDQDKAQIFGGRFVHQPHQNGVDAHRFTGAGRARHKQVGHRGQVAHHHFAAHSEAERDLERLVGVAELLGCEHRAHIHRFADRVGHLDADGVPAGDRRLDAHGRGEVEREIVGADDKLAHGHAVIGLQLIAGDRGAVGIGDLVLDAHVEGGESTPQDPDLFLDLFGVIHVFP